MNNRQVHEEFRECLRILPSPVPAMRASEQPSGQGAAANSGANPFFGTCNFRKMIPISAARRLETLRGHLGNPNVHAEPSSVDLQVRPEQRSCMGRNTAHVLYMPGDHYARS